MIFGKLLDLFRSIFAGNDVVAKNPLAALEKAQRLVQSDKHTEALQLVSSILTSNADSECLKVAEEYKVKIHAALAEQQARLLDQNSQPTACAEVAEHFLQARNFGQAIEVGRSTISVAPQSALGYRIVGQAYLERFRQKRDSVDGMNALQHLTKAHKISPSSSLCLVSLAELFILLRAPKAALKFLDPPLRAFPKDPILVSLKDKIDSLPPEDTSQIQDLFLRNEEYVTQHGAQDVGRDQLKPITDHEAARKACLALYFLTESREVIEGFDKLNWNDEAIPESLGLFGNVLNQCSERMGLGEFVSISMNLGKLNLVSRQIAPTVTAFYLGDESLSREQTEEIVRSFAKELEEQGQGIL